jgi:hypothetical protein
MDLQRAFLEILRRVAQALLGVPERAEPMFDPRSREKATAGWIWRRRERGENTSGEFHIILLLELPWFDDESTLSLADMTYPGRGGMLKILTAMILLLLKVSEITTVARKHVQHHSTLGGNWH